MRVLVCGGRDYRDPKAVYAALDALDGVTFIIEGGAQGADCYAAEWADKNGVSHAQFNADWKAHGRAAGPIRNLRMLKEGKPDLVLAFPGGRGTANMVKQARAAGVRVESKEPSVGDSEP